MKWINVDKRLPEPKTMCLTFGNRGINIVYYTPKPCWASEVLYGDKITHWMELPKAPESSNEKT